MRRMSSMLSRMWKLIEDGQTPKGAGGDHGQLPYTLGTLQ